MMVLKCFNDDNDPDASDYRYKFYLSHQFLRLGTLIISKKFVSFITDRYMYSELSSDMVCIDMCRPIFQIKVAHPKTCIPWRISFIFFYI